jgi:hypothetical protein
MFNEARHVLPKLRETHDAIKMRPAHDTKLRYSIPIPKGWGRATAVGTPDPGVPEPLGVFSPSPDLAGPRVIVSVKRLQWEVDPLEWVRYGWIRNGWKVAVARRLEAPWTGRFEIGGFKETDGIVQVRRATGFLDNGRLLRADVAAPQPLWPRVHDMLWPCGVLLDLREPTGRAQVEAQPRRKGPGISFKLPKSWRAGSGVTDGSLRWIAALEGDAQQCAALRIDVTSRRRAQPLDHRQRAIAADLRAGGLLLDARIEAVDPDCGAELPGWRGHHRIMAKGRDGDRFEVRLAHRETDTCTIDYAMLAPEPGRCHLDWMRATRALDVAIASTVVFAAKNDAATQRGRG